MKLFKKRTFTFKTNMFSDDNTMYQNSVGLLSNRIKHNKLNIGCYTYVARPMPDIFKMHTQIHLNNILSVVSLKQLIKGRFGKNIYFTGAKQFKPNDGQYALSYVNSPTHTQTHIRTLYVVHTPTYIYT